MEVAAFELGLLALCFLVAIAFFAGLIDSVAGGGGLLAVPALLLVGLPPHMALGTSKFMGTAGTTAAFITYARNGAVVWRVAAVGAVFAFLGSAAGTGTALRIDSAILGKVILVLLPVAALITFMPKRTNAQEKPLTPLTLYVFTPLICTAIGFYDGFFGPGTGSFFLIALHLALGLGLVAASGTAKAFNLASNISSLTVFLLSAKVFWLAALPMAAASMAGNILGSRLALRNGPAIIRKMLFISLALLFVTLVWRYYE